MIRDEFLSEEDLDLRNLTTEELIAYWNLWLEQAQATNDLDARLYSHGVFAEEPLPLEGPRQPQEPSTPTSDSDPLRCRDPKRRRPRA